MLRRLLPILLVAAVSPAAEISHGPMLGRLSSDGVAVWARTARAGEFRVRYGTEPTDLRQTSAAVATRLEHDNTGWVHITGLKPATVYYYQVEGEPGARRPEELSGSFRTLPDRESHRHPVHNPQGLFNFSFEYACGNQQANDPSLPTFRTMLDRIEDKIDFAILNGDWLYEEQREYPPTDWLRQVGAPRPPRLVDLMPTIVGVWENYKLYLTRGKNLAWWHREVPNFFMFDDHEMLNDINGAGTPGHRDRRAAFRDIGLVAWENYLGWANPNAWEQPIHLGRARFEAGGDVLVDEAADFRELKLDQMGTLTVHWGTPDAGVNPGVSDTEGGDPNAGVYKVEEVMDRNRLRISPAAPATGEQSYSIGRFHHFRLPVANAELFFVDTRGHRQMHGIEDPFREGISILGEPQKAWLKQGMRESKADFLFMVSSVNLMVPHILGRADRPSNKDEAWTAVAAEREELIEFWDSLGKPVMVLTGDLHNSFAIKITDNVWEFASGPHNSTNHFLAEEAGRPSNGRFESRGRECDIRWSTFIPDGVGGRKRRPVYTVVRINNTFRIPGDGVEPDIQAAFAVPQMVLQYYDGLSGDLLYAESILAKR